MSLRTATLTPSPPTILAALVLAACVACSSRDAPVTGTQGARPPGAGSHFASAGGSATATGASDDPWDLATALRGADGRVLPGDTIWLRGGTYRGTFTSTLAGTPDAPIVVRQFPGERATVDGNLVILGRQSWYWDFEVANTDVRKHDVMGVDSRCPGCRFIDLVIHDHSGNGLGMWSEGPDQEAYGNIIYDNGFHGQNAEHNAHGIYGQNRTGSQRILNNIIFDQFGYGVHVYGSAAAALDNYVIEGNTAFDNGIGGRFGMSGGMDYQVGGETPLRNLVFTHNNSYRNPALREDYTARLGYDWGPLNDGALFTDNYFVGRLLVVQWSSLDSARNVVVDTATPDRSRVLVQPSVYERGRGNVIVYNWAHASNVEVDLSGVLRSGEAYEVRRAQDFYGPPVASGVYGGGTVELPLGQAVSARSITGKAVPSAGNEFAAFVVVPR